MTFRDCSVCAAYAEVRMPVVIPEMAAAIVRRNVSAEVVLTEFMSGVHERHLARLPTFPGEVWHDPTHGTVDRDIQERVDTMNPTSRGQRVAMESTLQGDRDRERGVSRG
jgi:hypothetical protein